ncbi:MAG: 30S ribosomal protein S12 methylthiotransferase RimO [Candidatus Omnitrophica bacterium]|nr:30S ribosomal protein S12 methylthiotransferase RimO [Candidatus Omnitrophota bacterium]
MDALTGRPMRVGMISLGCAKNLVDAEIMLGSLARAGIEITTDAALADVVIINTCSFIDAAQEESVDVILETARARTVQDHPQGIVVAGCLPQRFRDELPKLLPEVDAFMGIDQIPAIGQIVRQAYARRTGNLAHLNSVNTRGNIQLVSPAEAAPALTPLKATPTTQPDLDTPDSQLVQVSPRPVYIPDYATPHFRLTPRHFAYLKTAEGCNHPCSFCVIPRIRGRHRSRAQADIVQEARQLIAAGVKELNLISQDTTYYGLDLRPAQTKIAHSPERSSPATNVPADGSPTLCSLLRELNDLPGDFWIRLLYTHPAHWTEELIQTIVDCPKVARYIDIPLQHIHPVMLERMRRETSSQYIADLLTSIRARIPGIALRTTFIVGFPGETESSFQTLLNFIQAMRFERLGVFTYSSEKGTRAAAMARKIPDRVKRRRLELAMTIQQPIARQAAAALVGQTLCVLVERQVSARDRQQTRVSSWEKQQLRGTGSSQGQPLRGPMMIARTQADAPDIDGRVYVRGRVAAGEFAQVKIIGHTDYDLVAVPAD